MTIIYEVRSFQSGTVIVAPPRSIEAPYLYVHHSNDILRHGISDADNDRIRHELARDLESFLNGGPRPSWLLMYVRTSDDFITGPKGGTIRATGPMILPPNDNGRLAWMEDPSPEAQSARKALIDRIWVRS